LKVYEKCIELWVAVFYDKKLCKDFSTFMQCLHVQDKRSGCKADIIRHLISMLGVVGNDFLKQMRKEMKYECK